MSTLLYTPFPRRGTRGVSLWEAAAFSATLSLLFVFVYGGSNLLASQRTGLAQCYFGWELAMPFVPALIVPYLSLDLFFVSSFFLCADRFELRSHASRIALAILIAGVAFVLFPLNIGFERPEVSGWTAPLFQFLWWFDKPHNLAPSLHVALTSLLWPLYLRRFARLRFAIHTWFALMVVSPLLTLQHHVLDVVTGALLAQLCLFVFPGRQRPEHPSLVISSPNFRVAMCYASGAALCGAVALSFGSWFLLLIWPALSLLLIAIAYARGTSSMFGKSGGRLSFSTRVVLGPYLCGTYARLLFYRRRALWDQAASGVYRGALLPKKDASSLVSMGITGVLDLTAEHSETRVLRELDYLNIPILDLTRPSPEQLSRAASFIEFHAQRGGVYVHCALGISRSAAVADAYIRHASLTLQTRQAHDLIIAS